MPIIRINKIDAARRQIDAAIRMTFSGEDPVAVHSVAAAGHRIVRDICESRGDIESYLGFTDWIAPGFEKQFWKAMNASANFLKHAVSDANDIHELNEEISDDMIVLASKWYGDLGNTRSREMNTFATWWAIQNPKAVTPAYRIQLQTISGGVAFFDRLQRNIAPLNRADRLKAGLLMLDSASGAHSV